MKQSTFRRAAVFAVTAVLVLGCGSSTPSQPAQVTESPPSPTPTAATPSGGQTDDGVADGGELDTLLDKAVVTVEDGLRVRSAPGVGDDSIRYEPLLPLGTFLYAFNGPVSASGYDWYEVATFSLELKSSGPCGAAPGPCGGIQTGWVARGSRDGEPWLTPSEPTCPPLPIDPRAVHAVPLGERLACFSQVPITFQAGLISCNCDVDGGRFQPSWFGVEDQPLLLVEPSETKVPEEYADWLIVAFDPDGAFPDVLPIGQVVDVTGMFDHPAAQSCTYQGVPIETAGPPTPSSDCRFMFATTAIATVSE